MRNLEIAIHDDDNNEEFEIYRDVRHGREGFRVLRFVCKGWEDDEKTDGFFNWDENYQFYPTLDEAFVAIENRDFEKGRKEF